MATEINLNFEAREEAIHEILESLASQVGDASSAVAYAMFIIAREQVKATLLLAEQTKRIADCIEGSNGETGFLVNVV